jgi:hypothetical protein
MECLMFYADLPLMGVELYDMIYFLSSIKSCNRLHITLLNQFVLGIRFIQVFFYFQSKLDHL